MAPGFPAVPGAMPAVPIMPPGGGAAPDVPGRPAAPAVKPPLYMRIDDVLSQILNNGWPNNEPELPAWLDRMYAGDWPRLLAEAADQPPGIVWRSTSPRNHCQSAGVVGRFVPLRGDGRTAGRAGLQRQAAGDDAVFVENLPPSDLTCLMRVRHNAVSMQTAQTGRNGVDFSTRTGPLARRS